MAAVSTHYIYDGKFLHEQLPEETTNSEQFSVSFKPRGTDAAEVVDPINAESTDFARIRIAIVNI